MKYSVYASDPTTSFIRGCLRVYMFGVPKDDVAALNERHTVDLPYGRITYYPKAGNARARFVVYCKGFGHTRCSMQRAASAADDDPFSAQGRPLGYLFSWLRDGDAPGVYDKESHHDGMYNQMPDARCESRANLRTVHGTHILFQCERRLRALEPDEPELQP